MTAPAVIFDLDGVITDTAGLHFQAWSAVARELGIRLQETFEARLRGLSRMDSLNLILAQGGVTLASSEMEAVAARKNAAYVAALDRLKPSDALLGAVACLAAVRNAGWGIGLASASRNGPKVLAQLGLTDAFDVVIDPASVPYGKPAPDLFLAAAAALGRMPDQCTGVEDAPAGIAAIKAAGMRAIGIGKPDDLPDADAVFPGLDAVTLEDLKP